MNSKHLHTVLLVALVLLFGGLLFGTYGVNKLLTSEGNNLVELKAKSKALDQEQVSLNKAKQDIQKYEDLNKIAQAVVPQDKSQAAAVRQIVNIAEKNGITLASITFPASTLGNLPNGTAAAPSASAAAAPATPAASAANAKPTKNLSQLTALKNIPGVYQLPITITNDDKHPVNYSDFINFLAALEHNRRTSQVQTIAIQPLAKTPGAITFSLTLNEYIKP